ncbi:transposase [Streptomyces sp. SID13726]|nr:transposase [Streptomyces sp. SID13726]
MSVVITAGQRSDSLQFEAVLEAIWVPRVGLGRPRKRPDRGRADKAYDSRGNRSPRPGRTIIHSDHGVQFGSWAFTQRARASGLLPSMGSIGDCVDNAMMESFWARVQVELLNRRRWRTRLELSTALFEYLEIFHNRQRRHSALGMLSPVEYELRTPPA